LLPATSEYKEILKHFGEGFGLLAPKVQKIERIQNPDLFRLYLAKKKSMGGRENETRLFHGTNVKNTDAINGNNFNRSYAGSNVGRFCSVSE
jgi:poly [ADP-ribose] polymerase 10/14/15